MAALLQINCTYRMRLFIANSIVVHNSLSLLLGCTLTVYSVMASKWMSEYGDVSTALQVTIVWRSVGFGLFFIITNLSSIMVRSLVSMVKTYMIVGAPCTRSKHAACITKCTQVGKKFNGPNAVEASPTEYSWHWMQYEATDQHTPSPLFQ
jgi:hypothetical protein